MPEPSLTGPSLRRIIGLTKKGTDCDEPIAMRAAFRVGFMLTHVKSGG